MSTNTKIFIVMYAAAALSVVFGIPVHRALDLNFFSSLGFMYIMSRACLIVAGAAIGFRLALDIEDKKYRERLIRGVKKIEARKKEK